MLFSRLLENAPIGVIGILFECSVCRKTTINYRKPIWEKKEKWKIMRLLILLKLLAKGH